MKKKIIRRNREAIDRIERGLKQAYQNKYYNVFLNSMKWEGIDHKTQEYLMRQFWGEGSVACIKIKHLDMPVFAPFIPMSYDLYDAPSTINLINHRNSPLIPTHELTVDQEAVICYIQGSHRGIHDIVDSYIDRIVQVEMTIGTSLQTSKMPFLVGVSPADVAKAEDLVDRILNNEVAVFTDLEDLNLVKSFATSTPYIIDKLYQYKTSLENELLTYLGLDNNPIEKGERLLVDEVNANNQVIQANAKIYEDNLKDFCDRIKEVLGITITVKPNKTELAVSIHEDKDKGGEEDEKQL